MAFKTIFSTKGTVESANKSLWTSWACSVRWLGLLLCAGCAAASRTTAPQPRLSLSVPRNIDGVRTAYVDCKPPYPLHVLIRNDNKAPLRLWTEDCSWGYEALQLRVVAPDGKEHLVKKKPAAWYSNFPRYVTLSPGEVVVWNVELFSSVWDNLSWLPEGGEINTHMTVVYSVAPDSDSKQYNIWTGREVSESYEIPFYRVRKDKAQ